MFHVKHKRQQAQEIKMKTVIHVNQHNIRHNYKYPEDTKPVLTVKDYTQNRKTDEVIIYDKDGNEAARVVYSPDKPLSCGAKVWIQTQNEVGVG